MTPLEQTLNYKFRNSLLLAEALTHPSLAYETQKPHFDNQRLEFLGDAVLELVVTEHLYTLYPGLTEGDLTKRRAKLVSKESLHLFAKNINLGNYILLGKGEESNAGRHRSSTLADAFEALLGATYLDAGFDKTKEIIINLIQSSVNTLESEIASNNPKGKLQEILQAILPESPIYRIIEETGPDHAKEFIVEVTWQNHYLAQGKGNNKKKAESAAAQQALENKAWEGF